MAEVFGSIGNEPVELNNAATESTLRLLLQSSMAANKQSIESISKIAKNAGLDPATVAAANNNLNNLSSASRTSTTVFNQVGVAGQILERTFHSLDKTLGPMLAQFAQGTATASGFFGQLERLPGVFGAIAGVFQRVAKFQEDNLTTYQKISSAGVNFGGSLTELRMAALNTYMTLDEFSNVMKANSENLVNLGGNVNSGAMAFAKFSNSMLKSELGSNLLALGYTAEEANQSMLTYLGAAGISNAKDLQSNSALREGAKQYLEELDRLAQVTGKSRQEQENTMKKQKLDAEIQITASRMKDPAQRAAFEANVKYMTDMYGDAGKDLAIAQAQGRSAITKEGRLLQATAPGIEQAYKKMVDAGNQFGVGSKQYIDAQNEMSLRVKDGFDRIPTAVFSANSGLKSLSQATLTVANQTKQGLDSKEKFDARDEEYARDKAARQESEAAAAVEAQKAIQEMGQTIMSLLLPAIKLLTPVVNGLLGAFKFVANVLLEFKAVTFGLVAALGVYLLLQKARNIQDAVNNAKKAGGPGGVRGVVDALKGKPKGIAPLGTMSDPLYVIVLGKGLPGAGRGTPRTPAPGEREPKRPTFEPRSSRIPPVPPTPAPTPPSALPLRAERLERVAEGRAAQAAATTAKIAGAAGVIGGLITAISAYSEIQDINNKKAKGEITEQEASKEKGGVLGEAAGGLGGAAIGAAIGTAILPGIGTAIGGIAGGLFGSWFGKKGGESLAGGPEKPPAAPAPTDKIPKLAAGGIVTAPTLAVVGEGAAPEAVLPLDKLQSMVSFPSDVVKQLSNRDRDTQPIKISNELNDRLLASLNSQNQTITNQLMGLLPLTEAVRSFAKGTQTKPETPKIELPKPEPKQTKEFGIISQLMSGSGVFFAPLTAAIKQLSASKTIDPGDIYDTADQRSRTLEGLTSTTSMMDEETDQMFKRAMLVDKAFNLARAEKINMPGGITGQENSGFLSRISDIVSKILPTPVREKSANTDRDFSKSSDLINDLTSVKSTKTLETVNDQLIALNKVSAEMLRYLKETSDYSRRNVDATRSLTRDFFKI
jgi:hypothetical protein